MTVRIIVLLSIILSFSSCLISDTECCNHIETSSISKGLYVERYNTFCAGVFGELTECYITDSSTFRQKIGSYDEHEKFFTRLEGDKIMAYKVQILTSADTIERKAIGKTELFLKNQTDKKCLSAIPIFGKNVITCNNIIIPADSYKTEDGYFISQVQHQCDNNYFNAVYYTDSLKFSVFIGVYSPGSLANIYKVKLDKDTFNFYNIEEKNKVDTIKAETYLLTDLKKGKLIHVCK